MSPVMSQVTKSEKDRSGNMKKRGDASATLYPLPRDAQRRKGTQNPKNIPPNVPYENCSHFWEKNRFGGVDFFDFGGRKNL